MRAEMTRVGGIMPSRGQVREALRRAVRELSPGNAEELLSVIEAGEAAAEEVMALTRAGETASQDVTDALSRLGQIELAAASHPAYAETLAAQQRWMAMLPFVAARLALRGWEGPELPPFQRVRGMVPEELLEAVPADELEQIGNRAYDLMQVNKVAEGNSASPSSSPETPALVTAESSPTAEAAGSLPAKSSRGTRG